MTLLTLVNDELTLVNDEATHDAEMHGISRSLAQAAQPRIDELMFIAHSGLAGVKQINHASLREINEMTRYNGGVIVRFEDFSAIRGFAGQWTEIDPEGDFRVFGGPKRNRLVGRFESRAGAEIFTTVFVRRNYQIFEGVELIGMG